MTQAAFEPARWAVVSQFQRRYGNRDVNSFEFEIADHAISLALNSGRPFDAYFARNAWRDAKSIVLRQRRRKQARFVPLYRQAEEGNDLEFSGEVQDALAAQDGGSHDAEHVLVWADAYSHLRDALDRRNRYAVRCLDGWRDGETEQETSAALGISRDYVKKLRRLIRDTAAEVFSDGEWVQ
jgi:hypothetical protein